MVSTLGSHTDQLDSNKDVKLKKKKKSQARIELKLFTVEEKNEQKVVKILHRYLNRSCRKRNKLLLHAQKV